MRKIISTLSLVLLLASGLHAQTSLTIRVRDVEKNEPVEGAAVSLSDSLTGMTDSLGLIVFPSVKAGPHEVRISSVGFFKRKINVTTPQHDTTEVKLAVSQEEMEEVVVVSTRTKQNIDAIPTRIEVIGQDEIDERSTDKPGDISHAVKEQPGVQIQRTSASSGTFNIRLEGLRGKYVQVLKDGFPLFGGLSQNLSIAQIPPMDLRQIEIIKGPASTLYGGDAIAGVINLITKEPQEKPEYNVLFNIESTKSTDAAFYASQKIKWFGYSLIGQFRDQKAFDWNNDGFSDVPKLDRGSISPQLYFDISPKATLNLGFNYSYEKRLGGAMAAVNHQMDTAYDYLETNISYRYGTNAKFEYNFGDKGSIVLRSSTNLFSRELAIGDYDFGGKQFSTVSELHYHIHIKKHDVVVGVDFKSDRFREDDTTYLNRGYNFLTGGIFAQEVFAVTNSTSLEGGMRVDYNQVHGIYGLPHLAWMQRWNELFRTKLNFGMGYKLPTVFQDEAEEANYRNVQPIADSVKSELSIGGTFDLSVKSTAKSGFHVEVNELFFFTRILHPLIADTTDRQISYYNGNGYIQAVGMESSLKMGYRGAELFITYTLQDQSRYLDGVRSVSPLTSKHILSMLGSYNWRGRFVIGLDCYYYSAQLLSDGTPTHPIWEMGVNVQGIFKWFNIFANLENILDIRQTSFGPIVFPNPTYHQPLFKEVYAPLEGRLLNVGFKIKLAEFMKQKGVKKDID